MSEPLSGNRLLSGLPRAELSSLAAEMSLATLTMRDVLQEPGAACGTCYFPVSGVISLRSVLPSGAGVEVAQIGRDGMLGFGALLGERAAVSRAIVQAPGRAWRVPAGLLREQFVASAAVRAMVGGYVTEMLATASHAAVCNGLHNVQQRMARWLLGMDDRVPEGGFPATQEGLAEILGARRPTITLAAQGLQEKGLISYRRARIYVRDRKGLEAVVCECYRAWDDGRTAGTKG